MKLDNLQNETVALIKGIKRISQSGMDVLPENKKDLASDVQLALAKLGIIAIVSVPKATAKSTDSPDIDLDGSIVVTVSEDVTLNRSRSGHVTLMDAVQLIAAGLNLQAVDGDTLVFKSWTSPVDPDGYLSTEITFGVQFYLAPEPEE